MPAVASRIRRLDASLLVTTAALLAWALGTRGTAAQPAPTAPSAFVPPVAIVSVRAPTEGRWDAYALVPGAAVPTPLGLTMDAGGNSSMFFGSNFPVLSFDGRFLAYFDEGRLRVRDLREGTDREVPSTLGRRGHTQVFGFAVDSSSLLYFEYTHADDADVDSEEGSSDSFEGRHRILDLAAWTVRTVRLDRERQEPALLESANELLVVETLGSPPSTTTLVRLRLDSRRMRRTRLASTVEANGIGQVVRRGDEIAWSTRTGIVVVDRDGRSLRQVAGPGRYAEYQWPTFGPTSRTFAFEHTRRVPSSGGGFLAFGDPTFLDRDTGIATRVHVCQSGCRSGFEDESHLLTLDGTNLLRVDREGHEVPVATNVEDVAFAGATR